MSWTSWEAETNKHYDAQIGYYRSVDKLIVWFGKEKVPVDWQRAKDSMPELVRAVKAEASRRGVPLSDW